MLEAAPKMKCCYRSCLRRVSLNQLQPKMPQSSLKSRLQLPPTKSPWLGLTSATAVVVWQPGCTVVAAVAYVIFSLAAASASRLAILAAAMLAGTAALVADFCNADATAAKLPNAEVALENDEKLLLLPMLAAQSLTLRLENCCCCTALAKATLSLKLQAALPCCCWS